MQSKNHSQEDIHILNARALQVQRGAARAAVLGVNDGLVSTLCIVLAVAGAGVDASHVLLAGVAGLIAGAISMAAGEWVSVRSQVELFEGVLDDLRRVLHHDASLLIEHIEANFADNGMSERTAAKATHEIATNRDHIIELYTSRVMGINQDELGSPWIAAGSSFALFSLGAIAPLAPWIFTSGTDAIWLSIIFTSIASLGVGAYVGNTSGKNPWAIGARQLAIVGLASAVTYGAGWLFGINIT